MEEATIKAVRDEVQPAVKSLSNFIAKVSGYCILFWIHLIIFIYICVKIDITVCRRSLTNVFGYSGIHGEMPTKRRGLQPA